MVILLQTRDDYWASRTMTRSSSKDRSMDFHRPQSVVCQGRQGHDEVWRRAVSSRPDSIYALRARAGIQT
eukprot:8689948-Lingulodinium_polyedra.AAC.1